MGAANRTFAKDAGGDLKPYFDFASVCARSLWQGFICCMRERAQLERQYARHRFEAKDLIGREFSNPAGAFCIALQSYSRPRQKEQWPQHQDVTKGCFKSMSLFLVPIIGTFWSWTCFNKVENWLAQAIPLPLEAVMSNLQHRAEQPRTQRLAWSQAKLRIGKVCCARRGD